jgi:membrane-bound inhibitor of C-type lysozyme
MKKSYTPIEVITLVVIVLVIAFAIQRNYNKSKTTPVTIPVTTTTPVVTPETGTTVSYSCDAGKTITAVYYQGQSTPSTNPDQPPIPGGSVILSLSDGRTMTLAQTISADGTRYSNADGSFVFWGKGNGAVVLDNNQSKSFTGCVAAAPAVQ